MDKEEKKQKILTLLRAFAGHLGARQINRALGITDNRSDSKTHAVLVELMNEGKLEQSHDRKGFRITANEYKNNADMDKEKGGD